MEFPKTILVAEVDGNLTVALSANELQTEDGQAVAAYELAATGAARVGTFIEFPAKPKRGRPRKNTQ